MISLKRRKLLTNFSWLETSLCPKKQQGLTYSACGMLTNYRKNIVMCEISTLEFVKLRNSMSSKKV